MKFIDPRIDYAFKRIFGSSESKEILISFLNALIYDGQGVIQDLEIIDPNLPPQSQELKDTYLDVRAKLKDGAFVLIEMQILNVQAFGKRVIFNAAKTYGFQLKAGQGYWDLQPVIALTLTDFEMFPEYEAFLSRFAYREMTNGYVYPDREIELVFVELPKFAKDLHELDTITDKWIYFIKYARSLTEIPENMEDIPELHRAFEIADRARLTAVEVTDLERRELFVMDQQGAILLGREEGLQEGLQQGLQEGREQGLQQGLQEGLQQGLQEGLQQGLETGKTEEKYAIARNLLALLDNAAISQTTGLTVEEIQALREGL